GHRGHTLAGVRPSRYSAKSKSSQTLPFVPAVVDLAHGIPVLAAGGIGDGRGLAAALTLGAAGAMIGTRFEATHESLLSAAESKVMLKAKAADTTSGRAI
ncbi:nitronate monooxygenase, partial [Mycobacterium montefiorense]|uniref:nitronate monooxygenase n=1 Tax=Mycobacterium montefiorense TaxID=154654 RepID=UPI0021C2F24E